MRNVIILKIFIRTIIEINEVKLDFFLCLQNFTPFCYFYFNTFEWNKEAKQMIAAL